MKTAPAAEPDHTVESASPCAGWPHSSLQRMSCTVQPRGLAAVRSNMPAGTTRQRPRESPWRLRDDFHAAQNGYTATRSDEFSEEAVSTYVPVIDTDAGVGLLTGEFVSAKVSNPWSEAATWSSWWKTKLQ